MFMKIDRNIVNDGDVLDIQAHEKDGETTFVLSLSHRAANWQILLTETEMKNIIAESKSK